MKAFIFFSFSPFLTLIFRAELLEFIQKNFHAGNMIISAAGFIFFFDHPPLLFFIALHFFFLSFLFTYQFLRLFSGVDHEEFVELANEMFGGMGQKEPLPTAPQKYVGGSLLKVPLEGPTTAVAIGFEGLLLL